MICRSLASAALLALSACAGPAGPCNLPAEPALPTSPTPLPPEDCGAGRLDRYLNVLPTAEVKAAIAREVGGANTRYIAPGDAVTQDYRPNRLNVELGEDGRIQRFRCG